MIGQNLFKTYLSNWKTPPQFVIINGEEGSGRSSLIDLIINKFKYQTVICGTSVEEVRNIVSLAYTITSPTFYIFYNGDKLSIASKNALLKIVEDAPKNAFFIMRTEFGVIETLKNRSFYYEMSSYSFDDLRRYFVQENKEDLFNKYNQICKNIGQIKVFLSSPYEDIIDYCNKITDVISNVSQGNILNIPTKLNLDGKSDKWNVTLFINILEWTILNKYKSTKDDKYFQAIFRLNDLKSKLRIVGVNKQIAFDNFLLGLKYLL